MVPDSVQTEAPNVTDLIMAAEGYVRSQVSHQLKPLLRHAHWAYQKTLEIVQFSKGHDQSTAARVQHAILKQGVNALRAVEWLLLLGYTGPAAAVASSLFELRFYSNYILDDDGKAHKFQTHSEPDKFVWRPRTMMEEEAKQSESVRRHAQSKEREVKILQALYAFLSSLKHNNPRAISHTVRSVPLEDELGEKYLVGVFPDGRKSDSGTKAAILCISLNSLFYILRNVSVCVWQEDESFQNWLQEFRDRWALLKAEGITVIEGSEAPRFLR